MKTICSSISSSLNPSLTKASLEQILFLDIETTGLSPRASSLYLIGAMHYRSDEDTWQLTQWFADNYQSEEKMLLAFLETLENYSCLYHFNGRTFDIPYILHKCEKHHIDLSEHNRQILKDTSAAYSVDLLAQIRPLKKTLAIPKASQTDLERWLGICRDDRYSGGELIPIYSQYMQNKLLHPEQAEALEKILLLHNHDDMEGMLSVCKILSYRNVFCPDSNPDFHIELTNITYSSDHGTGSQSDNGYLCISFTHTASLPKLVTIKKEFPQSKQMLPPAFSANCVLELANSTGSLTLPILYGELKYFFTDYRDYYYLPEEDQAIHKSVAEFVDTSHRKKATAATCYQRKIGEFIPSLTLCSLPSQTPQFYLCHKDKLCFYQLPSEITPQDAFWKEYVLRQLAAMM